MSPPPTHRAPRRRGWPAATGSPNWRSRPCRRGPTPRRQRAALAAAEAEARDAADAEKQARDELRAARGALDVSRRSLAEAEREESRIAARRSGLDEALARLTASLAETEAAEAEATASLAAEADPATLADSLAAQRERVNEDRAALAEARAAVESLVREAELRSGRLAAIAVERQNWHERAANARDQIATLTERRTETEAEKESLAAEPAHIEAKRTALLSEVRRPPRPRARKHPMRLRPAKRCSPRPTRRRGRRSTCWRKRASSAAAPRSASSPPGNG